MIGSPSRRLGAILFLGLLVMIVPRPASAQVSIGLPTVDSDPNIICVADPRGSNIRYSSGQAANNPQAEERFRYYVEKFAKENGVEMSSTHDCTTYQSIADDYRRSLDVGNSYVSISGRTIQTQRLPGLPDDWATRPLPKKDSADGGPSKALTLPFRKPSSINRGQSGYRSASITLRYRFLICADEVQVAYSLDRSSLEHSREYLFWPDGGKGEAQMVTPTTEPAVPISVPLDAVVYNNGRTAASFIDKIAGEALGMGCFTGQTRKIGTVRDWFGVGTSREQMEIALARLTLEVDHNLDTFGQIPVRLLNLNLYGAGGGRQPVVDDTPATTELNKAGAAAAEAQTRKIIADKEAYRAALEKSKADNAANMALYRQQVAEREASNEAIRRGNEARMALYKACLAGDKAACQRYSPQ